MNNFNAKFLKLSQKYLDEKLLLVKETKAFQAQKKRKNEKSSKISTLLSKLFQ